MFGKRPRSPEFQILTSVTALERANFTGALVAGWYGDSVRIDDSPFTQLAADPTRAWVPCRSC